MEILTLFGANKNDKGLSAALNITSGTLKELGVITKEINLSSSNIPFYDGSQNENAMEIIRKLDKADGIIIATTAGMSGYSASLSNFFEHLEEILTPLKNKHCMIITMSENESSLNSIGNTIRMLGGNDSIRLSFDKNFKSNDFFEEILEKNTENFYRLVDKKQFFYNSNIGVPSPTSKKSNEKIENREIKKDAKKAENKPDPIIPVTADIFGADFLAQIENNFVNPTEPRPTTFVNTIDPAPAPVVAQPSTSIPQPVIQPVPEPVVQPIPVAQPVPEPIVQPIPQPTVQQPVATPQPIIQPAPVPAPIPAPAPIAEPATRPEDDIQEIAKFFEKKQATIDPIQVAPQISEPATIEQQLQTQKALNETARQHTARLVHFFQPQLSKDLNCTIQLKISGEQAFEGFITINGTNCDYYDGQTNNPTLTVVAEDKNWISVATGNLTAQKAFMTGQIKIKGNFVLLTRFDQIFNFTKTY